MIAVSVLIPTFRRPEGFLRAARSVAAQRGVGDFELIAVDNSPEGSALAAFQTFAAEADVPFRWVHEKQPGVARARNAALELARGKLIAWLDDDEEAGPGWLAALVEARRSTGAQAVFGPVAAKAPAGAADAPFYERLYSREGPEQSGPIGRYFGIGNSLQPRLMFEDCLPFDNAADQTGGEDDALFASWQTAGGSFAWASGARVTEHLDASRARLAHGLRRAFAYGQAPAETAWSQRRFATLLRHMAVGALQTCFYGAAALATLAVSRLSALALLDRSARGAGKVLWFWQQRFYGLALVR